MPKRRIARLIATTVVAVGLFSGLAACGGAKAGDGVTSPPSSTK